MMGAETAVEAVTGSLAVVGSILDLALPISNHSGVNFPKRTSNFSDWFRSFFCDKSILKRCHTVCLVVAEFVYPFRF